MRSCEGDAQNEHVQFDIPPASMFTVYTCVYIYIRRERCIYIYIYLYVYVYIHTDVYIYIHIHVYVFYVSCLSLSVYINIFDLQENYSKHSSQPECQPGLPGDAAAASAAGGTLLPAQTPKP